MGIFSLPKKQDELVLVFDIGSSSVKAALFYLQKSGIPKIIFSAREPIMLEDSISVDRFLALTLKALETVSEKVYRRGLGAPHKIFCVLSSPWHTSHTRIINFQKNTPFTFTPKLADSLIQKEIGVMQDEYLKKYPHIGNTLRLIELKNIKISLNGYEVNDPVNKKAKELEMVVFVSLTEEEVCKKIESTIFKNFSLQDIKFCSLTMASFTIVRDLYAHQENFLLINIGGEVTDIAMVKNNTLRESASFPLGINFMMRRIASEMHVTLSEAKSLISLFKDGHAEAQTATTLEPSIKKLKSEWLVQFQTCLANLSNDISIPAFVYITVDKDLADFFGEVIKTEQFNQYTLTESKFQIIFLNIQNLQGIATLGPDVIFNAFLTIDAVYINRFLSHGLVA